MSLNTRATGMIFKKAIPRRTFLRGVGATLALPLLDGMTPAFASAIDDSAATRLAVIYSPTGMCMIKTFVRYDDERGDLQKSVQFFYKKMKHRPVLEALMAPMFKSAYDYSREEFAFPDVWRNLQALYRKKKLKKREFDYFASLGLDQISLKVYIPLFHDLIKTIEANATLHGVRFGGEWFSVDVPIIMFKK
jgi:hypothetical protein